MVSLVGPRTSQRRGRKCEVLSASSIILTWPTVLSRPGATVNLVPVSIEATFALLHRNSRLGSIVSGWGDMISSNNPLLGRKRRNGGRPLGTGSDRREV